MGSSFGALLAKEMEDSEHWLAPADLLTQLDIHPGMTVAEIGSGRALYTLSLSDSVGPDGRVFAIEWRPWLIDELRARFAGTNAPGNVTFIEGRAAETHLPASSCDLVLLADIWHELEHQDAALDEARRLLRAGGRLAILNWRPEGLFPPGPPTEHRVSKRRTLCAVEMKSWSLVKGRDSGPNGYLLVFEITDESVQS